MFCISPGIGVWARRGCGPMANPVMVGGKTAVVRAGGELAVNHRSRSGSPGFRSPCLLMWLPGTRPGAQWDSGSGDAASGAGRDIVAALELQDRVGQALHGRQDPN